MQELADLFSFVEWTLWSRKWRSTSWTARVCVNNVFIRKEVISVFWDLEIIVTAAVYWIVEAVLRRSTSKAAIEVRKVIDRLNSILLDCSRSRIIVIASC